jgi:hypothetical protein
VQITLPDGRVGKVHGWWAHQWKDGDSEIKRLVVQSIYDCLRDKV